MTVFSHFNIFKVDILFSAYLKGKIFADFAVFAQIREIKSPRNFSKSAVCEINPRENLSP